MPKVVGQKKETKMKEMDHQTVRDFWGNVSFDYAVSDATGLSGGILAIWDRDSFTRHHVKVDDNFLAVEKKLQSLKTKIKGWVADRRSFLTAKKDALQQDINAIDLRILEGVVTEADRDSRISSLKELRELEHIENLDVALCVTGCGLKILFGGRLRDLSTVGAHSGPWKGIISALRQLKERGVNLQDFCHIRVGNGLFRWQRMRIGWASSSLRREPRGGVETEQWEAISALIQAFIFSPQQDKLRWTLDSSDKFSVSSARSFLDGRLLFSGGCSTRWNNFVPIKLNILLWRIALARIPSRDNLVSHGIVLDSTLCPVCSTSLETVEHVFADCVELRGIWSNISRWWNVPTPSHVSVDSLINWADHSKLSVLQRKCFDAFLDPFFGFVIGERIVR
ncbi:RNA-directed DNA polymerase, eukaryota [Artemisia annua]|uniref:RNA-directed DNA polymerase, eukaryota n=1 Tax=Artemisia annua TaxID=35608 RepID=A0A2U1NKS2_ARTAN|nr:RNA-directed DNA polymerase, eukaryota [Artemisia annua]